MPEINIKPQIVLLTSGQAVTFVATDDVIWNLTPPIGTFVPQSVNAAQTPSASATYVAPPVAAAQTIAVIASKGNDSASATISLTPDAFSIVPAKVDLKANETQQFNATVAGAPTVEKDVTWILSPSSTGDLSEEGLYKAPS